jgi:hypothetical protein
MVVRDSGPPKEERKQRTKEMRNKKAQ